MASRSDGLVSHGDGNDGDTRVTHARHSPNRRRRMFGYQVGRQLVEELEARYLPSDRLLIACIAVSGA